MPKYRHTVKHSSLFELYHHHVIVACVYDFFMRDHHFDIGQTYIPPLLVAKLEQYKRNNTSFVFTPGETEVGKGDPQRRTKKEKQTGTPAVLLHA